MLCDNKKGPRTKLTRTREISKRRRAFEWTRCMLENSATKDFEAVEGNSLVVVSSSLMKVVTPMRVISPYVPGCARAPLESWYENSRERGRIVEINVMPITCSEPCEQVFTRTRYLNVRNALSQRKINCSVTQGLPSGRRGERGRLRQTARTLLPPCSNVNENST